MSNTPAESVPAAQPQTQAADSVAAENARQPKKFDNVQKTVASKAKAFLNAFHSTGENIRGNINAALDGAGDAIAARKSGEIVGRKSGEQTSRRSVEPTAPESTSAPVATVAPAEATAPAAAPAATVATPEAKVATSAEAPAAVPAAVSTSNEVASANNAATDSTNEGNGEKRLPVGQILNERFRRTVDLVMRVGSSLRLKGTRTAESLGSSLVDKKERASRRFSRAPKVAPVAEANAATSSVPAPTPLPDVTAPQPVETTA